MKNIAIFASGSGTNAENIIQYFSKIADVNVSMVFVNNPDAYVIKRAERLHIESFLFTRNDFYASETVLDKLTALNIDFIVLSGFLWLVPPAIIHRFKGKIINIHPALLPAYGGKGMYGDAVHKAVVANGEKESGITIHYVNEKYDDGDIIFQAKCEVSPDDTPETVASKVHALEYKYFPKVIAQLLADC